jgi:two-component system sensor histidine kinase QseC
VRDPRAPFSLRRRLTAALALGFGLLAVGAGVAVASVVERLATDEFDAALVARARALAALTEEEGGRIELDYTPGSMPEFEREERPDHFQFFLDDGTPLYRSSRLARDLPRASSVPAAPAVREAPLPDGRPGRLVEWAFLPKSAGEARDPGDEPDEPAPRASAVRRRVALVVARGRESLDALVAGTRLAGLSIAVAAALGAALLAWRALRAGFRPIDSIAEQVGALEATRLGARVGLARAPRELAPVVAQVNALLGRLSDAFERERRFTGNVAHELRTPIAELRSLAAVGARWPDDPAAVARFFADVDVVAARMEGLVADLLLLARCQAGAETATRAPTNVAHVLRSAWAESEPDAAARGLSVRLEVAQDLWIDSDARKLAIVFGNLVRNAVAHARAPGEIRCTAVGRGAGFRVEISNPADPLAEDSMARLAEPFWRGDEARAPSDHVGLGLALATAVAAILGLDVAFSQDAGGTFRAAVTGPQLRAEPRVTPGGAPRTTPGLDAAPDAAGGAVSAS